jgi:hypothetical protein
MDRESHEILEEDRADTSDLWTAPEGVRPYVDIIGDEDLELGAEQSDEDRLFPTL